VKFFEKWKNEKNWKDKLMVFEANYKATFEASIRSSELGKTYLIPLETKEKHENFCQN
jgi:hypothetical protein